MDWAESFLRLPSRAAHAKFVSATPVADGGDSQALIVSTVSHLGFEVGSVTLTNRSGGACVVGLAGRIPRARWSAGQVTAAGVYTDDTTHAQDATTDNFALHDRTNSGSGVLVSCDVRFNVLGLVQGVAGDQTTPVLILDVWDGAAWVNIVAGNYGGDTLNPGATNERLICFPIPSYWVKGGTGTGVPATRYNLRVRHTHSGAGTADPVASQLFVGVSIILVPAVADGGIVSREPAHPIQVERCVDALFPVFGVAGIDNQVDVSYRLA